MEVSEEDQMHQAIAMSLGETNKPAGEALDGTKKAETVKDMFKEVWEIKYLNINEHFILLFESINSV